MDCRQPIECITKYLDCENAVEQHSERSQKESGNGKDVAEEFDANERREAARRLMHFNGKALWLRINSANLPMAFIDFIEFEAIL